MTDYTDPESPVADPHKEHRLMFIPIPILCANCQLQRGQHINDTYCPEWRLRQLDGDR